MSALITKFDDHGQVAKVFPATFHLVGKGVNMAVEVQISQNSTVEISLREITEKVHEKFSAELARIMGKR